ncbi:MAG: DHA2 family efflux MFS transporter permease subunit, partial [Acidobacteria bacterium]|nr:DHA2 family efflux MFS transporter permease subunit [Acidobacteriota bacterium]
MSCTFMEVLDTTIVNVSLPHIAANLSATTEEATWVLTSYLVSNAIVLPMTGWLASHFGRKRLLITAVAGFTTASFLCGFAPNLPFLVVCRIIQGASGGNLQPQTQAVLWETFPVEKRGKAMGFLGLGFVTAPLLGPLLGGWITENYSWRWVFYINIPVGIISILLLSRFMFDPPYIRRSSKRIDFWGLGLLVVGIGAFQMMLDKGQLEDWFSSNLIRGLALVAAVGLVVFVVHELRSENPVVDLRVFQIRTYAAGVTLIMVIGFVLYGSMVLLPLMLQLFMGYPAIEAGIATAPRGLGSLIAMPLAGALTARFDNRKLLMFGLALGSSTMVMFARLNLDAGYWDLFWPQVIQGFALAFVFVPLTVITMAPIPKETTGNATSIYSLMRNVGASVGIAAVATWLGRGQQQHMNYLGSHVSAYDPGVNLAAQNIRHQLMARGS